MEALTCLAFLVIAALYFLPTIVAAAGSKRKTNAILVLNLFLKSVPPDLRREHEASLAILRP